MSDLDLAAWLDGRIEQLLGYARPGSGVAALSSDDVGSFLRDLLGDGPDTDALVVEFDMLDAAAVAATGAPPGDGAPLWSPPVSAAASTPAAPVAQAPPRAPVAAVPASTAASGAVATPAANILRAPPPAVVLRATKAPAATASPRPGVNLVKWLDDRVSALLGCGDASGVGAAALQSGDVTVFLLDLLGDGPYTMHLLAEYAALEAAEAEAAAGVAAEASTSAAMASAFRGLQVEGTGAAAGSTIARDSSLASRDAAQSATWAQPLLPSLHAQALLSPAYLASVASSTAAAATSDTAAAGAVFAATHSSSANRAGAAGGSGIIGSSSSDRVSVPSAGGSAAAADGAAATGEGRAAALAAADAAESFLRVVDPLAPCPAFPPPNYVGADLFKFELDPFQKHAVCAIAAGHNVLVTAKTGSGKTAVGEYQIAHCLALGKRVFYTTPIKSLSNQKVGREGVNEWRGGALCTVIESMCAGILRVFVLGRGRC